MTESQNKMLPVPDDDSRFFWEAGKDGHLKIQECRDCAVLIHPPGPVCPHCLGENVAPRVVSGRGKVHSYSVNVQPWFPDMAVPFILASVELEEQAGLRVTTHLDGIPPEAARIGMLVEVAFRHDEDVWLPIFRPAAV